MPKAPTFGTLPKQFRSLAWQHQKAVYNLLLQCSWATLQQFSLTDEKLSGMPGVIAVLHTHSRALNFHPHSHMIMPDAAIGKANGFWRKKQARYLFNQDALATVFRAKILAGLVKLGIALPKKYPEEWVVHCKSVGSGDKAIIYLGRYLYRGVISNKNIISDDGNFVTFQYVDSGTGETKTRRLRGEDFIHLILQHTLPKGFRRARDYGFLHGNAKRLLKTVQWILQIAIPVPEKKDRPKFYCKLCKAVMSIVGFNRQKPG